VHIRHPPPPEPLEALLLALVEALLLEALLEAALEALLDAAPPAPPAPVVAAAPPVPVVPGLPPAPLELELDVAVVAVEPPEPLLEPASPDPVVLPLAELLEPPEVGSGEEHAGISSGVATIARRAVIGSFMFKGSLHGDTPRPHRSCRPCRCYGSARNLHEIIHHAAFCLKVRVPRVNSQLRRASAAAAFPRQEPLMNRTSCLIAAICSLSALASGGCSGAAAPTSSTITGSVAQASFPKPVSAITVKSDAGKTSTVAVGADGRFSVTLEKGAGYQLFLGADGKSMPIVLKSDQSRLQTQVHVKSGGASLSIGSVRYWNGGSRAEAKVLTPTSAGGAACVKGVFANSSQPCASGVAAATCSDEGDDEDSDGEQADEQGGESGADCVDGIDSTTHQSCDGGPAANPTDATSADEVGVPESNVSDDLGCGDEEDDDGEEAD
jgi:hypothetical protein